MSTTGWDVVARMLKQQDGNGDDVDNVSASSVRGLPAAWYSITKIAGHVGSLPLNLYERENDDDARIAREHPAYRLIRHSPNELMTASVFRETLQHHALLHGNGRAAIFRNGRQEPKELVILRPHMWGIVVKQEERGNVRMPARKFHVRMDDPSVMVPDSDCLHVMGLSDDGIGGLSVIDAAKQALGLAIAQQSRAYKSEKNGVRVKLVLKAPPGVMRKQEEAEAFLEAFNEQHAGPENADKAALLREGIEAQAISQNNQEAQAIESRTFSRQDIGLLFMVEQMLGDDSSVSYNSLESKNQAYLTNCLMRWLVRWQEECAAKLLTTTERASEQWYFRFVTAALLRGTTKERFDVYSIGRQIGVFSANEVRELEDMNRRTDPDGDSYTNPATTPGKPAADPQQTKTDPPAPTPADTAAARLRKVVSASVQRLTSVEAGKVLSAASGNRNFCGWLEEFYSTWTVKLSDAVAEMDGNRELAATWTAESKERLLAVAGRVPQSELANAVTTETAGWRERAEQLASAILS